MTKFEKEIVLQKVHEIITNPVNRPYIDMFYVRTNANSIELYARNCQIFNSSHMFGKHDIHALKPFELDISSNKYLINVIIIEQKNNRIYKAYKTHKLDGHLTYIKILDGYIEVDIQCYYQEKKKDE